MSTPPFENTRLKPGEKPDQARLEELFEALTRNNEAAFAALATLQTGVGIEAGFLKVAGGGNHKIASGNAVVEFAGGVTTSKATVVTHALNATPTGIWTQPSSGFQGEMCTAEVQSSTKTTFEVRWRFQAFAPVAGTKVSIYWLAIA